MLDKAAAIRAVLEQDLQEAETRNATLEEALRRENVTAMVIGGGAQARACEERGAGAGAASDWGAQGDETLVCNISAEEHCPLAQFSARGASQRDVARVLQCGCSGTLCGNVGEYRMTVTCRF